MTEFNPELLPRSIQLHPKQAEVHGRETVSVIASIPEQVGPGYGWVINNADNGHTSGMIYSSHSSAGIKALRRTHKLHHPNNVLKKLEFSSTEAVDDYTESSELDSWINSSPILHGLKEATEREQVEKQWLLVEEAEVLRHVHTVANKLLVSPSDEYLHELVEVSAGVRFRIQPFNLAACEILDEGVKNTEDLNPATIQRLLDGLDLLRNQHQMLQPFRNLMRIDNAKAKQLDERVVAAQAVLDSLESRVLTGEYKQWHDRIQAAGKNIGSLVAERDGVRLQAVSRTITDLLLYFCLPKGDYAETIWYGQQLHNVLHLA